VTDEEKALMRKRYMKCYVELLLVPGEALHDEFPHLFQVPDPGLARPLIPRNAAELAESVAPPTSKTDVRNPGTYPPPSMWRRIPEAPPSEYSLFDMYRFRHHRFFQQGDHGQAGSADAHVTNVIFFGLPGGATGRPTIANLRQSNPCFRVERPLTTYEGI
jgi:hypothetical protein